MQDGKSSTYKPWISRDQFSQFHPHSWQTGAPSPIHFNDSDHPPIELSIREIHELVQSFQDSAKRAVETDYVIIEIHGAHGYLIHQFLSPLSNHFTDSYGGLSKIEFAFYWK